MRCHASASQLSNISPDHPCPSSSSRYNSGEFIAQPTSLATSFELTAASTHGSHDPDAEPLELFELIFDRPHKHGLSTGIAKRRHLRRGVLPGADQQMLTDDLFASIQESRHQCRDAVRLAA